MTAIQIRNLQKSYGSVDVLDGLDLDVAAGEFVVLLGPSGCGKSTLLRMIAGLEDITDGTIAIGGTIVNDIAPGDRGVAMVFQNYALYPHMTVFDNIAFGLRRLGTPKPEIERRVREVSSLLAIEALFDRRPRQLSGGQQQRVAMARAMIKTPKVFLFDEPLSNLDAKLRDHLRVEIKRLHGMLGTTTVFVTHDQLEAMALADRIVVMNGGQIEQVGSPRDIFYTPRTLFVARFVGNPTMNVLEGNISAPGRVAVGDAVFDVGLERLGALSSGAPVQIGIRPRDLKFARTNPVDRIAARFAARVELTEMLGEEVQLDIQALGQSLIVLTDARNPPAADTSITLEVDRHALHLFDGATGLALRSSDPGDPGSSFKTDMETMSE